MTGTQGVSGPRRVTCLAKAEHFVQVVGMGSPGLLFEVYESVVCLRGGPPFRRQENGR